MDHRSGDSKRGTVYIAWDDGRHWGYWDLQPDGPPTNLEQMPEFASASEALLWGRARADRIVIRPKSDPGRQYWAGLGPPPQPPPMPVLEPDEDSV
jgi:hypothetical protein